MLLSVWSGAECICFQVSKIRQIVNQNNRAAVVAAKAAKADAAAATQKLQAKRASVQHLVDNAAEAAQQKLMQAQKAHDRTVAGAGQRAAAQTERAESLSVELQNKYQQEKAHVEQQQAEAPPSGTISAKTQMSRAKAAVKVEVTTQCCRCTVPAG